MNGDYLARVEAVDALRDVPDASSEAKGQARRNGREGGAENIRRSHVVFCREAWRNASSLLRFAIAVKEAYPSAAMPDPEGEADKERARFTAMLGFDPDAAPAFGLYVVEIKRGRRTIFWDKRAALRRFEAGALAITWTGITERAPVPKWVERKAS